MKKYHKFLLTILCTLLFGCSVTQTEYIQIQDDQQQYEDAEVQINILKYDEIASHPKYKCLSLANLNPQYDVFILECCNFPKNQEYIITQRRMAQKNPNKFIELFRFVPLEDGLWFSYDYYSLPFFFISPGGYAGGEKITLRVQSKSGRFKKEIDIVPFPIHAESQNKEFSLDATLTSWNPVTYNIKLNGLEDGEEYQVTSNCIIQISSDKYYKEAGISLIPEISGVHGGTISLTVTKKTGDFITTKIPYTTVPTKVSRTKSDDKLP